MSKTHTAFFQHHDHVDLYHNTSLDTTIVGCCVFKTDDGTEIRYTEMIDHGRKPLFLYPADCLVASDVSGICILPDLGNLDEKIAMLKSTIISTKEN